MTPGPGRRDTPGAWGPTVEGGRRWRWLRPLVAVGGAVVLLLGTVAAAAGFLLYRTAESNLTRVDMQALDRATDPAEPLNVLLVGSDSREGLTSEQRRDLDLGEFDGSRSDTMILVSVTPDRDHVTVVSFPRDLMVSDDGQRTKLADTFAGGADNVVDVLRETFDVPIHHYVQVSVPGFLEVVRTVGDVGICLEEPLVDSKSGADLPEGCQRLSPEQALAFVRSREGARGDFRRIERQQTFLQAMLDEIVQARTLVDLPRLVSLVEQVAGTVTTDDELGLGKMRRLAQDLRGLADGRIPMTFVPGYTETISGRSYVIGYEPGVDVLFDAIRAGDPVPARGSPGQREDVEVLLWNAGAPAAAGRVESTLRWAGFGLMDVGPAPLEPATTTVYHTPDAEREAGWVAATLGAEPQPWPDDVEVPAGASVAVAVTDDTVDDPPLGDELTVEGDPGAGSGPDPPPTRRSP